MIRPASAWIPKTPAWRTHHRHDGQEKRCFTVEEAARAAHTMERTSGHPYHVYSCYCGCLHVGAEKRRG